MAILVTGGDGYIGSQCVLALIDSGYDVVIMDNRSTGHSEISERLMKFQSRGRIIEDVDGSLLNPKEIEQCFRKNNIDAVIHFAASSQVEESVRNPEKYYVNNVIGTINLLNTMIRNGIKKIVYSSSAATFGNPQYIPIDEKHPQHPINPYGRTKLFVD